MSITSLINIDNQNIITINSGNFILRLDIGEISKEIRLKPFMSSILYRLFEWHPEPLPYDKITQILEEHDLIISDYTRMHRKLSEIRQFIGKLHPSLEKLILNNRGSAYSLPLSLKDIHMVERRPDNIKFASAEITKAVQSLDDMLQDSIKMTSNNDITSHQLGYVIDRYPVKHIIVEKIAMFNECEKIILKEIRLHEADFTYLRISYFLSKLKTYVGLARISEYPISKSQWIDWLKPEIERVFDVLKKTIKFAESL